MCSNTTAKFSMQTKGNKFCKCIFKGKGLLNGTTYSGHNTCTTCGGTYRNFDYHIFGIFDNLHLFSFAPEI
jgi:hypothetical protein